jgi:redox-sensitive bicupin YhaK (pirin superfamily)
MALATISVRKAADIPRYAIDASSVSTHFSSAGDAAASEERFGALSIFNDDVLGPSMATRPSMYEYVERITYVVDGYFRHDDTLGNDFVLQPGDIERFSFGSGSGDMVKNNSDTNDLRSIVLSIDARDRIGALSVDHRSPERSADGQAQTLIDVAIDDTQTPSPAMSLHQRGRVAVGLPGGFRDDIRLEANYGAYIYAIAGSVGVGDVMLAAGDVATVRDATELNIFGDGTAHALVVVVPLRDYAQPAGPTLLAPAGAQ